MRLGAIQSNYVPFRGYFDFIASCDIFVFHDCVQYTKQDWRNRNKVKLADGLHWITVPVKDHPTETPINEIEIAGAAWREHHKGQLEASFAKSHYREDALELWDSERHTMLSKLNQSLTRSICDYLDIRTTLMDSKDLYLTGTKTDRLIQMCKALGADVYLSGPAAKAYLDERKMAEAGIKVEWKHYDYSPYPQPWGAFEGAVTVLDLIANVGPDASQHIRCREAVAA